ncbi:GntR family transcriptional regulator / MocR family aminotransferase [Andreprevotia lacus DSM 23236]|jgi:GntR family transcriptional regulator/MocR family aminotransferase|uniref:Putative 8-amino-7-oxononanoate synthase n=1 Tax=Andreprevotia lacus DSM 23236 TaxID=1121001 RepID=A0A1W1XQI2_9NEIS|nr:PLP-dependent aminotransferase family protein [Andreprevotia lacus]SMC25771.1 GntR family transcriptional regulator / MocR family aminotransferase [Andreprevotia lacus DSM 23236]
MDYALLFANHPSRRHDDMPRQRQLYLCLRDAILDGTLPAGTALQSSRSLAGELAVARNSVLYAYEQLAAEGLVETQRQRTVVAAMLLKSATVPAAAATPRLSRRSGYVSASEEGPDTQQAFTPGVPDLADFPLAAWRRLLDQAWRDSPPQRLGYGDLQGEAPLRNAIAEHVRLTRGVRCTPGQVFVTDGTQQSLDLCARALADVDDIAWMESPGYGGALTALLGAGLQVVGQPVDDSGIDLSRADWQQPPKLIYVTPSHQYPLGAVLSLPRRLDLLAHARQHDCWIIEDDYDSEFRHDGQPLPALQGLEADAPVLYLGTFSKSLMPALRIGFMVVPEGLVAPLKRLVRHSVPRGRQPEQLALAECLRSGLFASHLRRMRKLYRERRDALITALQQMLPQAGIHGASAGMHLAITLPPDYPDTAILGHAAAHGLVVRALSQHHVGGPAANTCNGLILGYAQVATAHIPVLVRQLAATVDATRLVSLASSPAVRPTHH